MHENNWIPASIPPAQDGMYLTTTEMWGNKFLKIWDFKDGIWGTTGIVSIDNAYTILAWQPLPAVYKAGD